MLYSRIIDSCSYEFTLLFANFRDVYNVPTRIGLGLGHGKDLSFNLTAFSNTHNPTVQIEERM